MGAKKSKLSTSKNVYLEIAINNQNIGRIEIELNDAVSMTVFRLPFLNNVSQKVSLKKAFWKIQATSKKFS